MPQSGGAAVLTLACVLVPTASRGSRASRLPTIAELYPPELLPSTSPDLIRPVPDTAGVLQLDVEASPDGLRRAAAAQAYGPSKQIVLMTTNLHQLDIAVNLVANLAAVGVHHYLVVGHDPQTCKELAGRVACVWSTLMAPFRARLAKAMTNEVRSVWLIRQIYLGRLARMGFSPMLLDADVILFRNPFTLVEEHLGGHQAIFLGDTSAGYISVNGGTVYLHNPHPDGPVVRIWREFERRVFALINTTKPFPVMQSHKTKRGWIGGGLPSDPLLYDQNVLDWVLLGEIIGDREFIGRGFVPTTRTLTADERLLIKWTYSRASSGTPDGLGTPDSLDGMMPYASQYVLRTLSLPGPPGCVGKDGVPRKLRIGETGVSGVVPCGPEETMLKAPAWLFSAESDIYPNPSRVPLRPRYSGERVVARQWSAWPPATSLVHFVCTRWPGSEGRKIGMRLLRKWFTAQIVHVLGADFKRRAADYVRSSLVTGAVQFGGANGRSVQLGGVLPASSALASSALGRAGHPTPAAMGYLRGTARDPPSVSGGTGGDGGAGGGSASLPVRMIGFKAAVALGDAFRKGAARCKQGRAACRDRWRGSGPAFYDRNHLANWHRLLALLALATSRTPVLPLFECVGVLDPRSRNTWVVNPPAPQPKANGSRSTRMDEGLQPACAFRVGEGCFEKLKFPDDLAAVPVSACSTGPA